MSTDSSSQEEAPGSTGFWGSIIAKRSVRKSGTGENILTRFKHLHGWMPSINAWTRRCQWPDRTNVRNSRLFQNYSFRQKKRLVRHTDSYIVFLFRCCSFRCQLRENLVRFREEKKIFFSFIALFSPGIKSRLLNKAVTAAAASWPARPSSTHFLRCRNAVIFYRAVHFQPH